MQFCYSGFIAERMNLRYFLTIGTLGSGIMVYMFGMAKYYNIHTMPYFLVVQVCSSQVWPIYCEMYIFSSRIIVIFHRSCWVEFFKVLDGPVSSQWWVIGLAKRKPVKYLDFMWSHIFIYVCCLDSNIMFFKEWK